MDLSRQWPKNAYLCPNATTDDEQLCLFSSTCVPMMENAEWPFSAGMRPAQKFNLKDARAPPSPPPPPPPPPPLAEKSKAFKALGPAQ